MALTGDLEGSCPDLLEEINRVEEGILQKGFPQESCGERKAECISMFTILKIIATMGEVFGGII